jgi:O-acetyl-ADP-ribose deacetylase (regulator of RNase III)/ADP-ribose pyrophosphatase YjhB (NUDIX family)
MKIKETDITVVKADITDLKVDAIVNPANNELEMGGGLAAAIKKKGGKTIEDEARKKGPIGVGEAVTTKAGTLSCTYVIHAATMGMDFKTDEFKIRLACRNALLAAEKLKIKTLALPALGCGTGGFPALASAKIMAQEVYRHLRENSSKLKEIVFCLFDEKTRAAFEKGVLQYLNHVVDVLQTGPFVTVDCIAETDKGVIIVGRSNPPFGWALPGGFLDYGESLEEAVRRELKEEAGVELENLRQFHTYSRADRDPRFHTVTVVFVAKAIGTPHAGDDAASLDILTWEDIDRKELCFDHAQVLQDYLIYKETGKLPE